MFSHLRAIVLLFAAFLCLALAVAVPDTQAQVVDAEQSIAEPLPEWQPPLAATHENQLIVHTAVGETAVFPLTDATNPSTAATTVAVSGETNLRPAAPAAPNDFGNLSLVNDTDIWPWQVLVRLTQTFPSGATTSCSGTLIDAKHVLTAAHCIYTFTASRCTGGATSCWASNVEAAPGYENGIEPFGTANSESLFTWTAWTSNRDYDYDMALIRLDRPVGALTGWFGYGYNNTDTFFTNSSNVFRSTGYPGSPFSDTQLQYTWSGFFDTVQPHILYHNDLSYGGQSGSGTYLNSALVVYGVLSHGHDSVPDTGHTRLTSSKYSDILYQINDVGTPIGPDLIPLNVNLSPGLIVAGQQLTSMNYLLHNYALADWNSCVNVRVYLSTNDTISTSDELLQTHQFCGFIGSKDSWRVNLSMPPQIPYGRTGLYWIGVILEDGSVTNPANATSGRDAAVVAIRATDSYEPDNSSDQAATIYNNTPQNHSILPATDVDWLRFTLTSPAQVTVSTNGPTGDTRLWLYNNQLQQLAYDDDSGVDTFSEIATSCDQLLPAGTYYLKVDEYNNNDEIAAYTILLTARANCTSTVYLPFVRR